MMKSKADEKTKMAHDLARNEALKHHGYTKRKGEGVEMMKKTREICDESEEERKKDYEERARAALVLLQGAIRASGVEGAELLLKRDKWDVLYIVARSGGASHRIELIAGRGYARLTHIMQEILQVI